MHAVKANFTSGFVGAIDGGSQVRGPSGYTKHTPSSRVKRAVPRARARMKDLYAGNDISLVDSRDPLTDFDCARISTRRHHNADRSITRPAEVAAAHSALDRCFHGIEQVAFHAHQDWLRLRIAKAAIEFQHHGAASRHHDSAVKNALVFGAFGFHSVHHRLRNMMQQPLRHLLIEKSGERICAHPARIRTSVPVAETLMVLRRDQRRNIFAVTNYQKRNFIAVKTFFKHYA